MLVVISATVKTIFIVEKRLKFEIYMRECKGCCFLPFVGCSKRLIQFANIPCFCCFWLRGRCLFGSLESKTNAGSIVLSC